MIKVIVFLVALGIFIVFLDVRNKTRNCESKEEEDKDIIKKFFSFNNEKETLNKNSLSSGMLIS